MNTQQFQSCIEACYACATACDTCAASCLQEDDPKMMAGCIALDMDCAQICRTAAGFMARGSEMAAMVCKTCEEVCEACARECGQHQAQHCQDCAAACNRCAAECRAMAGNLPGWKQQQAGQMPAAH